MRLDKYLVEHGYFESRNRALEAIKTGLVRVNGKSAKASRKVTQNCDLKIGKNKFYISRAAKKLESFLSDHPLDLSGKVALDIGSSTGGFAQILLENGIASLDCVDVGSEQLHHSLRDNPLLSLHERTDIRDFRSIRSFDLITCDVSFISVLHIIDYIDRLASAECDILLLYKPQFEVGREAKRDSRGVVQDSQMIAQCQEVFIAATEKMNWTLQHYALSEIAGKEGNREYLYHFVKIRPDQQRTE